DQSQGFKGGGVAIVPLDLQGVSKGKAIDKIGQRPLNQGEIFFDEVRIPVSHMVMGTEAYGFVLETVLTMANAMMGATFTGVARAALEYAIDYAKERVQFGRPIGSFQAIKHKCADMMVEVESARSASYYAGWAAAEGAEDLPVAAALAKAFCSDTYFRCAAESLQIHGGVGFSWEYDVHLYFKRAKSTESFLGDAAYHRERVAQHIL
ncbi:MAG: acyl-CoA dehydrogenase family protein, partial [Acidobacteriota bacterium]